jgi:hypothetical protein
MTKTTTSTGSFMLLLRGGVSNRDLSPEQLQDQIARYMSWIEKLRSAGHFVAGEPLEETGKVLSGQGGSLITDGPFTESKEAVGGYFILRARDFDEAVELARACPIFANNGTVEVRPIQDIPGA